MMSNNNVVFLFKSAINPYSLPAQHEVTFPAFACCGRLSLEQRLSQVSSCDLMPSPKMGWSVAQSPALHACQVLTKGRVS